MKRAFIVAGLAWGDEAKGATTDWLTHQFDAELIVRYNGGAQACHSVVTPDGKWHPFQQFGAGMFHPHVKTHLSRFMLINPMNMMREEEHLVKVGVTDAFGRTTVDRRALIITPFHVELNRAGQYKNGLDYTTCGQGIGVCREMHELFGERVLFAGDLRNEGITKTKLKFLHSAAVATMKVRNYRIPELLQDDYLVDHCWNWYKNWPVEIVCGDFLKTTKAETIIFEGAQGVLLDETHGEPGFNTWTDTTFNNAQYLLDVANFDGKRIKVGVIRTYYTRHGAGPFPTEDLAYNRHPEPHNNDGDFQGQFRCGRFDTHLFDKALGIVNGVDWLAVNHMDRETMPPMMVANPDFKIIEGRGPTRLDRKVQLC